MSWETGDLILNTNCKIWSPEFGHLDVLYTFEDSYGLNSWSIKDILYYTKGMIFEEEPYGILNLSFENGETYALKCKNDLNLWSDDNNANAMGSNWGYDGYEDVLFFRSDGSLELPIRTKTKNTDGDDVYIGNVDIIYYIDIWISDIDIPPDLDGFSGDIFSMETSNGNNSQTCGQYELSYSHIKYWENKNGKKFLGEYVGQGGLSGERIIGGTPEQKNVFVADAPCWK